MPIDSKSEAKKSADTASSTTDAPSSSVLEQTPIITTPMVFQLRGGRTRRRRYSRGTRNTQRLALGISKAAYRTANSFAEGFDTFSRRSDRSARRRRDGMVRDSLRNASRGIEDGLRELGRAPSEIANRVSRRTVWRVFRMFTL